MRKVYVALFIHRGVLGEIEVYGTRAMAESKRDEWKESASEEDDVVDVLRKEIISQPGLRRHIHPARVTPLVRGGTPLRGLGLPDLPNWMLLRLYTNKIYTVEELCQVSEYELSSYRNIGVKTVGTIKQALAARGLSLAL